VIDSPVKSDLGCYVYDVYVGCLIYADDIILLSASVVHLQSMLDICRKKGSNIDIIFNAKNLVCSQLESPMKRIQITYI